MKRWSLVRNIKINSLGLASILQIGDNEMVKPKSQALAVQRELPYFREDEGNFDHYSLFSREIPLPEIYELMEMSVDNEDSAIQVGSLTIVAVSSSCVIQVGANEKIEAETRIKYFRQFVTKMDSPNP